MAESTDFDWSGYLRRLRDEDAFALAAWLAAEGLSAGEFVEVVDAAHIAAPLPWRGAPEHFVSLVGRPVAKTYATRKRRFARLHLLLEQALMSGAFPGEVAPDELELPLASPNQRQRVDEVLGALARAIRGL